MVSLSTFSKVTEEGVLFSSPFNGEQTMLSPEESMRIQVIITCTVPWVIDLQIKVQHSILSAQTSSCSSTMLYLH